MNRKTSLLALLLMVIFTVSILLFSPRLASAHISETLAPAAPQDFLGIVASTTLSTSFTYQGRLTDGGLPANGVYDFGFVLQDAPSSGNQIASTYVQDVQVTEGLFTVALDFGQVFDGTALWMVILVRPGDSTGGYTAMSPAQALTAAPYALALPGLWTQPNATSPNLIGGYHGNEVAAGVVGATISGGGNVDHPNRVTADYATVGGGLHNYAYGVRSTVGGGAWNWATANWTTIGGGYLHDATSDYATIGGGTNNDATGNAATVAGGGANTASGYGAAVGGGTFNTASGQRTTVGGGSANEASGDRATIAGGTLNIATGYTATIGGGYSNVASGNYATVGGGSHNDASDYWTTVSGGYNNEATGSAATIAGGAGNWASAAYSTVSGGQLNNATAFAATIGGGIGNYARGEYATVAGGHLNIADGNSSFAAGNRAKATHDGSFVLADSTDADFNSVRADALRVRFNGGATFAVNDGYWVRFWSNAGELIDTSTGAHLTIGGVWTNGSDRAAKENFAPVDGLQVLAQLAAVPIQTWNYQAEDPEVRRMGPTAQDFYAAFGLGGSDISIATIDADGVALAAIQALYGRSLVLEAENDSLQNQLEDLEARLATLEKAAGGSHIPSANLPGGWPSVGLSGKSVDSVAWWVVVGLLAAVVLVRRRFPGGGR